MVQVGVEVLAVRRKKRRRFSDKTRAWALYYAGGRCQRCGTEEDLTLHHANGRHDNRLSSAQVLCETCHFWKHHRRKRHDKRSKQDHRGRPQVSC